MSINWQAFTPWSSLGGGALIGLAAAALVLANGKIAGISGIVGGLLRPTRRDLLWRFAFISGLIVAPLIYRLFGDLSPVQIDANYAELIIAGVLVGLGTRFGAGCTSGHGVCGISRLSPRSLVATPLFMAAGFATVYLHRHFIG
jgi:uncharacterized protein